MKIISSVLTKEMFGCYHNGRLCHSDVYSTTVTAKAKTTATAKAAPIVTPAGVQAAVTEEKPPQSPEDEDVLSVIAKQLGEMNIKAGQKKRPSQKK